MQKVISALEHLERFAAEADAETDTMDQLRSTINHLVSTNKPRLLSSDSSTKSSWIPIVDSSSYDYGS